MSSIVPDKVSPQLSDIASDSKSQVFNNVVFNNNDARSEASVIVGDHTPSEKEFIQLINATTPPVGLHFVSTPEGNPFVSGVFDGADVSSAASSNLSVSLSSLHDESKSILVEEKIVPSAPTEVTEEKIVPSAPTEPTEVPTIGYFKDTTISDVKINLDGGMIDILEHNPQLLGRRTRDVYDACVGSEARSSSSEELEFDAKDSEVKYCSDSERYDKLDWMRYHFDGVKVPNEVEMKDALASIVKEHPPSFVDSVKEKLGIKEISIKAFVEKFANFTPEQVAMLEKCKVALDSFENIVFFMFLLYKSNSYAETFSTVGLYLSTVFGSDYLLQKNLAAGAITAASSVIYHAMKKHKKKHVVTQSFSDDLSSLSSVFSHVMESGLVKAISGLLVTVASLKLFDKDVADHIYEIVGKPRPMSLLETAKFVLDALARLVKAGENWITGKMTFFQIFMEDDPLAKALVQYEALLATKNMTYTGLAVPGKMDRVEWLAQSSGVIAVFAVTISKMAPGLPKRAELEKKWALLQVTHLEMIDGSSARPTPIGIVLYGHPGTGKSNLTTAIYEIYSHAVGRQFKPSHVYSKAQSSQYWEGYRGREHPICFLSEVGSDSNAIALKAKDEMISLLTSLLDSNPLQLDMAEAGSKGKVYFQSELLLIDTNNRDMNIPLTKTNPAAYFRRFLWVNAVVKPQYRMAGSMAIDPEKCDDGSEWLDKYTFAVHLRQANDAKSSTDIFLMNHQPDDTIHKFFTVMTGYIRKFLTAQAAMVAKRYDPTTYAPYFNPIPVPVPAVIATQGKHVYTEESKSVDSLDGLPRKSAYTHETPSSFDEKLQPHVIMKEKEIVAEMRKIEAMPKKAGPRTFRDCLDWLGMRFSSAWNRFDNYVHSIEEKPAVQAVSHLATEVKDIAYLYAVERVTKHMRAKIEPEKTVFHDTTAARLVFALVATTSVLLFGWNRLLLFCVPTFVFFNKNNARNAILLHEADKLVISSQAARMDKVQSIKVFCGQQALRKIMPSKKTLYNGLVLISGIVGGILAAQAVVKIGSHMTQKALKKREKEIIEVMHVEEDKDEAAVTQGSVFLAESEYNDELTQYENETNCGNSYVRVPSKMSKYWNSIKHTPPVVHVESLEVMWRKANCNVRRVTIDTEKGKYVQFGLMIGSTHMLINEHALPRFPSTLHVSFVGSYDDEKEVRRTVVIGENDCVGIGNDLMIVNVVGITSANLVDFFPDIAPDSVPMKSGIGKDEVISRFSGAEVFFTNNRGHQIPVKGVYVYHWENSMPGMCGWPLVRPCGNSFVICGIHGGAIQSSKDAFAPFVTKSQLSAGLAVLKKKTMLMPIHCAARFVPKTEMPIPQSAFVHSRLQGLEYMGKTIGTVLAKNTSKLKPTFLVTKHSIFEFEDIVGHHPHTIYLPPMMQKTVVDGKYFSPINYGLEKMCQQRGYIDRDIMRKVAFVQIAHLEHGLRENGVVELRPLTAEAAINGVDYDSFLRRIDAMKAAGYSKPGSKSKYIPIVAEIDGVPVREPVGQLKKEILDAIKEYLVGNCSGVVYVASLKDEPREKSRALSGNTRLFYISPIVSLILARMYLAPLYSLMVQFSKVFHTAIGIDMHRDGHIMWKRLSDFSKLWIEGDYSKYDLVMPFEIKWCTATIIEELLRRFGYNEQALCVVRGILSDEMFPMVELLKDLFCLPGIQCSGAYATAEKNSMDGIILLMAFWYSNPALMEKHFYDYVDPEVYGDDVLAAVKPEVSEEFNNWTYQQFCKDVYNMDFTPASKSGELSKFVTPETASFLKRTIRYHPILERNVTPLSMESLHKTLRWYIPSKTATPHEQYLSSFNSVLVELFLQVDEDVYNRARRFLKKEYEEYFGVPLEDEIFTYSKTYDLLQTNVLTQSKFVSSAHVSSSAFILDEIHQLEIDLKEAELVLEGYHNPTPGLSRDEARMTTQYISLPDVRRDIDRYYAVKSRVDGLVETIKILQRAFAKRTIKVQSKKISLFSDLERGVRRIKQLVSPVPNLTVDGHVKETLFSHLDVALRYNSVLKTRIDAMEEIGLTPSELKEGELDVLQELSAWLLEEMTVSKVHWMKWCEFCGVTSDKQEDMRAVILMEVFDILDEAVRSLISFDDTLEFGSVVIETQSKVLGEMDSGVLTEEKVRETVHDASGDVPITQQFIDPSTYDMVSSTQLDLGEFLSRPVQIGAFNLPLATDVDYMINPWDFFLSNVSVRAKLKNIGFLKGTLCVRVNFSGMPFHSGKLMVAYVPLLDDNGVASFYATNFTAYRPNALKWLSQRDPVYMDVKANKPLDLRLGYVAYQPMWALFNTSATALPATSDIDDPHNAGQLFFSTLNQIKSSLATASLPYVEVYAWMENVVFGCTTGSAMQITTESRFDERKMGPVESTASRVAEGLGSMASAPIIGPYAKASAMVAKGIAGGAALLGLSYPTSTNYSTRMHPDAYENGAQTVGLDMGKKITLDPMQELTIDTSVCGSHTDEMSIAWLASRESLLDTFTWHATHAPLTVEWSSIVHPAICVPIIGATNQVFQPTAMAFASRPFAFWRAKSIEFRFMVVCNAFCRGKFAIVVEPNVAQYALISSNISLNKEWNYIVDLQQTQEISICVEWMSARPWLNNVYDTQISTGTGTITSPVSWAGIANGFIAFVPLTEIQSNDGEDLQVNVFVKANDLEVNYYTSDFISWSKVMTQSKVVEDVPISCVTINPSGYNVKGVNEHYFGERPVSFAALLKRFVTTTELDNTAATFHNAVTGIFKIVPDLDPAMGANRIGNSSNLLSYLRYAYLGMRGGFKRRVRLIGLNDSALMANTVVTLGGPEVTTAANSTFSADSWGRRYTEGSVTFVPRTNAGVTFVTPMYTANLFLPAGRSDPFDSADTCFTPSALRNYMVVFEVSTLLSPQPYHIEEQVATDEDFRLARFYAAPPYSIPLP